MTNSTIRILLIEDEAALRQILSANLKANDYVVCEATTGKAGLEKATEFHPHLIILDLGLPDIDGYEVLKELRKWTTIPVIVLTVADEEAIKVRLLDAGADDFLTKPYGPSELLARVRVCTRHHGLVEATPIFESDDLKVDLSHKLVTLNEVPLKLTKTEYELLSCLVRDHGKVVSQSQLLKKIWGVTAKDESHYLRIYISQLRKKIEHDPSSPKHILTEPGVGYRLV